MGELVLLNIGMKLCTCLLELGYLSRASIPGKDNRIVCYSPPAVSACVYIQCALGVKPLTR
jgi:hypothetical protein